MNRHQTIRIFLAAALASALACGMFPSPTPAPNQVAISPGYYTSTPQVIRPFVNVPTPVLTAESPSRVSIFGDSKVSDTQGSVKFEDSLARRHIHITVQSAQPVSSVALIDIQFISDGHDYLVAALDPAGKYAPQLISGTYKVASAASSDGANRGFGIGRVEAAQLSQDAWSDLDLTLKLLGMVEKITTAKDISDLFKDMPSLEKWSTWYADTCWTGSQIATAASAASGVAGIILPAASTALTLSPEPGLLIDAMVAISSHVITEDATNYLRALPGTYRLRLYHFPYQLTFVAVEFRGKCETPTSSSLATATSSPTPEGLASLAGRWSGKVSGNSEGSISLFEETVVFTADCLSGPFCLTYPDKNDPAFVDIPFDFKISTGNQYCFTRILTFSQSMSLSYQACFSPRGDGKLDYEFGGPLFSASGILHRVETGSVSSPTEPAFRGQTAQPEPKITNMALCPQRCNGSNATSTLPEGTTKIYAQWNYSNIPPGAIYLRTWSMNGKEWVRYSCTWPGPSTGTDSVTLIEPGGLHSGAWELVISVNGSILARQQIQVEGQGTYWSPAGSFKSCYGN